jgi:hypothetical protein
VRLHIAAIESECLVETCHSLFVAPHRMKHPSGMVMRLRECRVVRERAAQQPDGLLKPALLATKHAEMMERPNVVMLAVQDGLIHSLGFG